MFEATALTRWQVVRKRVIFSRFYRDADAIRENRIAEHVPNRVKHDIEQSASNATRNTVLLLCGEYPGALDEFHAIVCLSPNRQLSLAKRNIASRLLSDFAPGEEAGSAFDLTLYRDLDACLHAEARGNPDARWAPTAYLLIVYRLSRYLWVKRCLGNLVRKLAPAAIHLSSHTDCDLVHACRAIAAESGIRLETGAGGLDPTSAHVYLVRTYGLPRALDPRPLRALRWRLARALPGGRDFLVQTYTNIQVQDSRIRWLNFAHALNIWGRIFDKAFELLRLRGKTAFLDRPIEFDDMPLRLARSTAWCEHFAEDEIKLIDCLLRAFDEDFPADFLDRIEAALVEMLRSLGVKRVVMIHDRLDACRMLAHAAHRLGIAVDYLVHGLTIEDFAGERMDSPFLPDRILAWNQPSAAAFQRLGWRTAVVAHPQFRPPPRQYRPLTAQWSEVRVLLLVADWVVASQASREDCAIVELAEVCAALAQVGIPMKNIHAKIHGGTQASLTTKRAEIEQFRQLSGHDFTIVDPARHTTELMPQFDLVIFGITSGIFEAVMLGTPAVVFGMSLARVGGLETFAMPAARNEQELVHVLEHFDNESMREMYSGLAASLRSGSPIMEALETP